MMFVMKKYPLNENFVWEVLLQIKKQEKQLASSPCD